MLSSHTENGFRQSIPFHSISCDGIRFTLGIKEEKNRVVKERRKNFDMKIKMRGNQISILEQMEPELFLASSTQLDSLSWSRLAKRRQ